MKRNSPFAMLRSPKNDRLSYKNLYENEEFEVTQLPSNKKLKFLEKEVQTTDTLQSIALEFNVSVADLKRVNNIHKDNEIFARKIIKIPHKPYSLLLESKFFKDKDEDWLDAKAGSSKTTDTEEAVLVDLVNNPTITESAQPTPSSSQSITSPSDDPEETDVLLHTRPESPTVTAFHCDGADGDMSWGVLLLLVICIGIGGPAVYIWYFWGHLEKSS